MSVISVPSPHALPGGNGTTLPAEALYRLSVEQYHAMIREGILKDGDPVELVEGILVRKMTKNPPHTFATQALRDLLPHLLRPGWFVNDQEPVTLDDGEPEPDVAVIRGDRRQYLAQGQHPGPGDTALAVEVADSSLGFDQTHKARSYGRAGVPVYWIVNLIDRRVQVYTGPTGPADQPGYAHRQDFGPGEEAPVVLDGQEIGRVRVGDLLL
jgi:Uma2 family endonuclease